MTDGAFAVLPLQNLNTNAPAIKSLGIPGYNWWEEASTGVSNGHQSTKFAYVNRTRNPPKNVAPPHDRRRFNTDDHEVTGHEVMRWRNVRIESAGLFHDLACPGLLTAFR